MKPLRRLLGLVAAACLPAVPALAQASGERPSILTEIGFDQRLGESLPLDLPLRDEAGRAVRLGDYFKGRPVVLARRSAAREWRPGVPFPPDHATWPETG